MSRLATSFALSGWSGFLGVTALSEVAGSVGIRQVFGFALEAPAASGIGSAMVAVLAGSASLAFARSLVLANSAVPDRQRRGEFMGFAATGAAFAMVLAALVFGAPFALVFDRIDLALWSVGLTLVAIVFDACIQGVSEDDEAEEIAFQRTVRLIEASIPRQNHRDGGRADEDRR